VLPTSVVNNFNSKLSSSSISLTAELRRHALNRGWPSEIVNSLAVVKNGGLLDITYPEQFRTQIENLEYGDGPNPPSPVLRSFNYRADQLAEDIYEETHESLIEASRI
jgi:hypothetical protein